MKAILNFKLCSSWVAYIIFWLVTGLKASYSSSLPLITYGSDLEGGKIACLVSDNGIDNLVAAKADISAGITWGGEGQAIGPSAQSDTDGAANTKAIITTLGNKTKYAALLCTDYEIDSSGNTPCHKDNPCYKDWFLPSRKQLDCLFQHKNEIGGFANDFYWSSTEFSGYPEYSSWDKFFGDGEHPIAGENDFERVRCVRVFTP